MSERALSAAFRAVRARLTVPGNPVGGRVFVDAAPAKTLLPYALYYWAGGGERNAHRAPDAEIVLVIKVVADRFAESQAVAAWISGQLNDHGVQDDPNDHLDAGPEWAVLTVTEEDAVHFAETFANAVPITHAGARFRFILERI